MIIFDLDGTLLDTAKDLEIALNHTLHTHNLPQKTTEETLKLLGNGIDMLVAGAIPNGKRNPSFNQIFATFKDYYSKHLNDYTKPYDGIIDLLTELKSQNTKMGIISNKFDEGVKELAQKFFPSIIEYAQGVTPDIKKKPSPDAVFSLINQLNAQNEVNIYIGDSEVDIETAKNANIPCISVSWGFRTRDFLESISAQTIVDTPKELLTAINKILKY
jgi:phosphoglycolate phosphatase